MIHVKCPNAECPASYQVSDDFLGKNVVCKKCKTKFKVENQNGTLARQKPASIPTDLATAPHVDGMTAERAKGNTSNRGLVLLVLGLAGGGIALCLAVSCIAGLAYYFWPGSARGSQVYGGIEISSTEIRPFAYEFSSHSSLGFDFRNVGEGIVKDKSLLATLDKNGDFDPQALKDTVATIKTLHKQIRDKHHLPADRIVIACGSGVFKQIETRAEEEKLSVEEKKKRVEKNKKRLQESVREATGQSLEFVSAKMEADLQISVLIPEKMVEKTVLIDIGNSGCRGGCLTRSGKPEYLNVVGVKAVTEKIKKAAEAKGWKKGNPDRDRDIFIEAAAAVIDAEFRDPLVKELKNKEELTGRLRLELVGGIPWIVTTYKNPAGRGETHTPLASKDIDLFYKEFRKLRTYPEFTLPKGISEDLATRLTQDNETMRKKIPAEQVVAGTEMLRVLSEELRFSDPGREVYFNNFGQEATVLGLMQKMWEKTAKK